MLCNHQKKDDIIILGKVEMVASRLEGRDAYGVNTIKSDPAERKKKRVYFRYVTTNASVWNFILTFIGLVVELIKLINKK